MSEPLALEALNITKRFPGVLANDSVNFNLREGEIHALLGENGAGKSTLMNVIYGLYSPDEGEVYVDGQQVQVSDPNDAIDHGIGMVHQHFMLVPVFTVAENIVLGSEITRGPSLDMRAARQKIHRLSEEFGLRVDPTAVVEDLSVGVQQRVEIIKALYRNARILVLDEPTAVLTPQEAEDLFRIMRQLTERGVSIIFITHKLKEVLAIADRITVMRRGRVVGTTTPQDADEQQLASMMVGRDVVLRIEKGPAAPRDVVLEVQDLVVNDERGVPAVRGVSFQVRAGEVLGIAGVQGNGQTELAQALTGLRSAQSGHVRLDGKDIPFHDPRFLIESGMAHIPEDRQKHGLVLAYSVADNMVLCSYYRRPFSRGILRQDRPIREQAVRLIEEYDVRTPGPDTLAAHLSGGNQQKVIVARELSRPVRLLIANQPTRGLDVGSIEFIHRRIIEQRDEGSAVLLISAELDEILALADRIAVIYHGEIVATMPADEATREQLGLLMAGSRPEEVEDEVAAESRDVTAASETPSAD
ncbi:MAG TPA: ABC transporter ATP-binding protein [Candidatus Sulfomarinibacteraceae bacterium]|nr:ABC transporter ATP-binding protein [Candidatus Sulfomarinibacteraceae bacterium]